MPRREFSASVKKARLKHSQNRCEGEGCSMPLRAGFHFDHDLPDGLGGEPTFENCRVLCVPCHKIKTKLDRERMQKADNVRAKRENTRAPRKKIEGRGFEKSAKPPKPPLFPNLPPSRLMRGE